MRDIDKTLRTRAELARRLSQEIKEPNASQSLREIAEALDAEADKIAENVVVPIATGPPDGSPGKPAALV